MMPMRNKGIENEMKRKRERGGGRRRAKSEKEKMVIGMATMIAVMLFQEANFSFFLLPLRFIIVFSFDFLLSFLGLISWILLVLFKSFWPHSFGFDFAFRSLFTGCINWSTSFIFGFCFIVCIIWNLQWVARTHAQRRTLIDARCVHT